MEAGPAHPRRAAPRTPGAGAGTGSALRRALEGLEAIHDLVDAVVRARDLPEIYREAIAALRRSLRADRASVLLFDAAGVMRFVASHGLSEGYRSAVEGHSPWTADTVNPRPIVIADAAADDSLGELRETILGEGIRALAFIPLMGSRLLGKFMVYADRPRTFDPAELRMAETIAAQIAFAIERRRDEQTLVRQAGALARSNAELQAFAYASSHDLHEPLRNIASYAQLLARRYGGRLDPDADEFLRFIVEGVERMQDLIDDLLAYSRVDREEVAPTTVPLGEVLGEACANLRLSLEESRAAVRAGPLPEVRGDPRQLVQLFQNLLANAVKFRREGPPRIRIAADADGDLWRVAVEDDGIGVPPEHRERIFGLFQRLHDRGDYPGTGLGLAICRKIVERHGGRMWAEGCDDGGTRFLFTLPRA